MSKPLPSPRVDKAHANIIQESHALTFVINARSSSSFLLNGHTRVSKQLSMAMVNPNTGRIRDVLSKAVAVVVSADHPLVVEGIGVIHESSTAPPYLKLSIRNLNAIMVNDSK